MTLFTACGLLKGINKNADLKELPFHVMQAYVDWYHTQFSSYNPGREPGYTKLSSVPALYASRAPGATCLSAISGYSSAKSLGSIDKPVNNSKGCGGVMRVAPVALFTDTSEESFDWSAIPLLGAEISALTHGHPISHLSSAAFVEIIRGIVYCGYTPREATERSLSVVKRLFSSSEYLNEFEKLIGKAISLSTEELDDLDAIRELGEGWVAEEALAIAVYCSLKHQNSFEDALIAAVNHSGDSDSTGAICGNIMGAMYGERGLPKRWLKKLELCDVITSVSEALCHCTEAAPESC
jgi:ADP-ribosylglycohydrolase